MQLCKIVQQVGVLVDGFLFGDFVVVLMIEQLFRWYVEVFILWVEVIVVWMLEDLNWCDEQVWMQNVQEMLCVLCDELWCVLIGEMMCVLMVEQVMLIKLILFDVVECVYWFMIEVFEDGI